MFDFLPDQPAYQYPDLFNVAYVMLWAFFLASLVAVTHRITFRGDSYPAQFFQSLVLGSVVTAMVMMAVGDSLARGLGVFGAMAIIRFRTRIDDPRNVLFLFAALSSGLAVGVYGFQVSFAGTLMFCIGALVLHYSPFRYYSHSHLVSLRFSDEPDQPKVEACLARHCFDFRIASVSSVPEGIRRLDYSVSLRTGKQELIRDLAALGTATRIQIRPIEFQNIG